MATRYHLLFPFLLEPDLNNPQYNRTYIYTSAKLLTILKDVQRTFSTWAISSRKTPEILRLRIPHPRILSFPSRNWQGPRTMCLPLRDPVIRHLPQLRLLDHLASTINSRYPPPQRRGINALFLSSLSFSSSSSSSSPDAQSRHSLQHNNTRFNINKKPHSFKHTAIQFTRLHTRFLGLNIPLSS